MDCPFCGNDRFITHTEMKINRWNQKIYYAHNTEFHSQNMLNNCLIQATNNIGLLIVCGRRKIYIKEFGKEFVPIYVEKETRCFGVLVAKGYNMGS